MMMQSRRGTNPQITFCADHSRVKADSIDNPKVKKAVADIGIGWNRKSSVNIVQPPKNTFERLFSDSNRKFNKDRA